jgi:hypothetical protein
LNNGDTGFSVSTSTVQSSPFCRTPVQGLASTKAAIALAALALAPGRTVVGLAAALSASFLASLQSPTFVSPAILPSTWASTAFRWLPLLLELNRQLFCRRRHLQSTWYLQGLQHSPGHHHRALVFGDAYTSDSGLSVCMASAITACVKRVVFPHSLSMVTILISNGVVVKCGPRSTFDRLLLSLYWNSDFFKGIQTF